MVPMRAKRASGHSRNLDCIQQERRASKAERARSWKAPFCFFACIGTIGKNWRILELPPKSAASEHPLRSWKARMCLAWRVQSL